MSSFVRRSVAAAGTVVAASGVTVAVLLGSAGAAHADPGPGGNGGPWCSGSTACVKPNPEFSKEASKCIPPAVAGGAMGAPGGPGTAAGGFAMGGAMCAYNKAVK